MPITHQNLRQSLFLSNLFFRLYKFILLIVLAFSGIPGTGFCQMRVHGPGLHIGSDTLALRGFLEADADITGSGILSLIGQDTQQIKLNGHYVQRLHIQNPSGVKLTGQLGIKQALSVTEGIMILDDHNLVLSDSAMLSGFGPDHPVVTSGNGYLVKKQIGPAATDSCWFPVSSASGSYHPVLIRNHGITDDFQVRAVAASQLPSTGPPGHHLLQSWEIRESNPGGSDLEIRTGWQVSDEPNGFNRNLSGILTYGGNQWNLPSNRVGQPVSNQFLFYHTEEFNETGWFTVSDTAWANRAKLSVKVFLQGAYSGSGIQNGLMRDQLRRQQALPLQQPFQGGYFTHQGLLGGTESITQTVLADQANPGNDIVDWMLVSLLDTVQTQIPLQTRAALLQRDGDLVDLDGYSPLSMPIHQPGPYRIGISHKNHLRIRSRNLTVNNGETYELDFAGNATAAYQDQSVLSNPPTLPVQQAGITRYCLPGGNTDAQSTSGNNRFLVSYAGSGNDRNPVLANALSGNPSQMVLINNQNYQSLSRFDLNLDGKILYAGSGNDPLVILQALLGQVNQTAHEHY